MIIEVITLLTIPAAIIILHAFTPQSTAVDFYFHPWDPTIATTWTAALLHSSWKHVLSNSFAYILTMLTAYAVFYQWNRRRIMWLVFVVLLISTPPVAGILDVVVLRDYAGVVNPETNIKGFSGVVGALAGMLLALIGLYGNDRTESNLGYYLYFAIYLLAGGMLAIGYSAPVSRLVWIGFALSAGFGLIGYRLYQALNRLDDNSLKEIIGADSREFELIFWSATVVVVIIYASFPSNPGAGETATNIVAHLSGLVWGFVITFLLTKGATRFEFSSRGVTGPR